MGIPGIRSLAVAVLFVLTVTAQTIGRNAAAGKATFTTASQLVVETVTVTDKAGKPIDGLTAKDFTVTENGKPQTIRFFEQQKLPDAAPQPLPSEHIHIYDKLGLVHITPEIPGSTRYKNRRMLALYFDMTSMPPGDQLRALAAAEKFVRTEMTAADLAAIMRYQGGSVRVLQDFTADRDRLLSILETMAVGEGQGFDESTDDASTSDTGAAFGQDDSEFNIFNNDRQLAALQTAAEMLGQLREKKSLIYFASGLRLHGLDNQAQLHATIDAAIRAGVSLWTIDARGLVAQAPLGDATKGSPGGIGMYTGASSLANTTNFEQSQDTLFALAKDTGGKPLLDNNDLAKGIVQAARGITSYYILGYYTTNTAQDGKFRHIKISLNGTLSAKLDYRRGYFAGKKFDKFNAADKERQLEDALMLPDPITQLSIAMEIDYFQLNRAEYFVPLVVKIPASELALPDVHLDFIGEIKDNFGTTITNLRDKINVKLSSAAMVELNKRPLEYDAGFTLLPGHYTIKFLARDDRTGKIGTFQTNFFIPDLNKVKKQVAISSVVLSSQRVDLKNAVYNAVKKKGAEETANPLVWNGQKLIPSLARVFRRNQNMYVYLQAYEQGAPGTQPLVALVSFYRGGEKVFETKPVKVTKRFSSTVKTMPIRFSIGLQRLTPGTYKCQVTVLNPVAQKAAFWRAEVEIVG